VLEWREEVLFKYGKILNNFFYSYVVRHPVSSPVSSHGKTVTENRFPWKKTRKAEKIPDTLAG